jgi:hypothetical protein
MSEQKTISCPLFHVEKESVELILKQIKEGKNELANYINRKLQIFVKNNTYKFSLINSIKIETNEKMILILKERLKSVNKDTKLTIKLSDFEYTELELDVIIKILNDKNYSTWIEYSDNYLENKIIKIELEK